MATEETDVSVLGMLVDMAISFVFTPLSTAWLLTDLWQRWVVPPTGWVALPMTFWLVAMAFRALALHHRLPVGTTYRPGSPESIGHALSAPVTLGVAWCLAWVVS